MNLEIDLSTGEFKLDSEVIAPLLEENLLACNAVRSGIFEIMQPVENRTNYTTEVKLSGNSYGLVLMYCHGRLDQAWMTWLEGRAFQKGYDTTEKDLLSDLKSLLSKLIKHFKCIPKEVHFNYATFEFPWGTISCNASLQIQAVGIRVRWNG